LSTASTVIGSNKGSEKAQDDSCLHHHCGCFCLPVDYHCLLWLCCCWKYERHNKL